MGTDKLYRFRTQFGKGMRHLVLILWSATTIFPLIWTFMNSFKDNSQIFTNSFSLPDPAITTNYPTIFEKLAIGRGVMNSVIYAGFTVLAVCLLSSMTGFYLAKLTRGRLLYTYFIAGMMIPSQALVIPMFVNLRNLHLGNTRTGIILVYSMVEMGFAIFVMTGFIRKSVPDELLEAAAIDGCSVVRSYFTIVLPLARTGIVTVGTFVFLHVWNEFFYALIFLTNQKLTSLNLTTFKLRGQFSSDYGLLATGVVILAVPALIIYAIFQEQVVRGLTAGAVKE